MKKVQITSITLLFIFMITNAFGQINPISDSEKSATEQTKRLPLKRGEIISLELVESISSDNIQKGDVVKLKVTNPVIVNGYTMINRGAYAEAIVRDVQRAKGYGRAGRIAVCPPLPETGRSDGPAGPWGNFPAHGAFPPGAG